MTYIKEIIFSAIICGFLSELSPGEGKSSGKIFKYVVSLVFLCLILSPLISIIEIIPGYVQETELPGNNTSVSENATAEINSEYMKSFEIISEEICKTAAKMASEKFGVPENYFNLKLLIDTSEKNSYMIKEVSVYPTESASKIKKEELAKYFKSIFDCEVIIISDD